MKKKHQDEEEIIFEEDEVAQENLGGDLQKKLKKAKDQLKKCEEEKQQYLDSWQRAQADFVNLRKQDEKDQAELRKYAEKALVEDLIGVLDSFEMAFSNKESLKNIPEDWRLGVEHIQNQLLGILNARGLSKIGEVGEVFNPEIHEAVANVPVEEKSAENTVVSVFQTGYKLHDKIIRHAKVQVGVFE